MDYQWLFYSSLTSKRKKQLSGFLLFLSLKRKCVFADSLYIGLLRHIINIALYALRLDTKKLWLKTHITALQKFYDVSRIHLNSSSQHFLLLDVCRIYIPKESLWCKWKVIALLVVTPHTLEIYARQFLFWMTEEIQMKKLSILTLKINQF